MNNSLRKVQKFYLFWKRLFDIIFSFVAIVVLSPLLILVAILVKCTSKGSVFFLQDRYGKNQTIFRIIKFRSMKFDAKNVPAELLTNEQQKMMTTKFGRFIRKTSIDELPQLFNVFIGQMSFIGPRPCIANKKDVITIERLMHQPSAYLVNPGISGYSQIKLKRSHDPKGKAEYDSYYVAHMSLWFDIKLFFMSFLLVFAGSLDGK